MAQRPIRIATRASKLALWQAHWVRDALLARDPTLDITLLEMTTEGDRFLAAPLAKVGGKGLFVKELETAMLDGRADLAVHSMKDVPVAFPEGLGLSVICAREDPSDAFVARDDVAAETLEALPAGARVGTASLRRASQVMALRPDLVTAPVRGNVQTRLAKLDNSEFDAILEEALATADLEARRALMAKGEAIIRDEGVTIQPFWRSLFNHTKENLVGGEHHIALAIFPERLAWT